MSEKPEAQSPELEEPQDGVYQPSPNSRVALITTGGKKMVEVEFGGDLLKKKLGEKRAARIEAARKSPPVTKQAFVEPKGWQRVGDAFLAGPLTDHGSAPGECNEDSQVGDSAMPTANATCSNKLVADSVANLIHSPNLEAPVIADRRADNVADIDTRVSWRYWLTGAGRAEFFGQTLPRWFKSKKVYVHFLFLGYVKNSKLGVWVSQARAYLRHEKMLWSRMGTRPYLRLRKYRKHGPPPAREVQWPGMSSIKIPEGYAADPVVFKPESDFRVRLQAALDVGHAEGLPTKLVVGAVLQAAWIERYARSSPVQPQSAIEQVSPAPAAPVVVKAVGETEFKQALEKDTITELDYGTLSLVGKPE